MTGQDHSTQTTTPSADDVEVPRLIDDEIVAQHLARMVEMVEAAVTDVDQLCSDLDDNRLAIAASVAWLVGDNARELQITSTLMQSRLTFLAGQNLYPFHPAD